MLKSRWKAAACATAVTTLLASGAAASASPAGNSGLSLGSVVADQAATSKVIVVLANQNTADPATRQLGHQRAQLDLSDQAPFAAQVGATGGHLTHQYETLNAFSATVSPSEAVNLAANPAVAEVVPDTKITVGQTPSAPTGAKGPPATAPGVGSGVLCPTNPAKPLLEPEALQLTHTAFADPTTPQAQNLETGTGVTVAFFADGLDINNPDLIRPDGSHVVVDYRDFSGDGINAPTTGEEAFGDASSIAAQGREVYDLSSVVNSAHPLPAGCTITVRGVAPGASLVAMKVQDDQGNLWGSALLEGLDWAVNVDHVNVLSESVGSNPIPDTMNDLLRQFNEQATAAGVTVVA
jgi:hypothetical protein